MVGCVWGVGRWVGGWEVGVPLVELKNNAFPFHVSVKILLSYSRFPRFGYLLMFFLVCLTYFGYLLINY